MPDRKPKPVRAWAVVRHDGTLVPSWYTEDWRAEVARGLEGGAEVIRVTITPEPSDA